MEDYFITLRKWSVFFFEKLNIPTYWSNVLQSITMVVLILIVAWFLDKFSAFLMRKLALKLIDRTKSDWDDILFKNKVFAKTAHFLPGVVILSLYKIIALKGFRNFIEYTIESYFILVFLLLINGVINSFYDIYGKIKGENANIKIYIQLAKVVLFSLGAIAIISIFANKNFIDILKGLGAVVTILLIVYKDTILGFVAGIQLSANDMVRVGDWVSLPKDNADGVVIDISLNTVKVQNWDKTITTIPTYKLMSDSFTNWKGMEQSGGRRIKRHINIDMDSVHFLSEVDIEKLKKIKLLKEYINEKEDEVSVINKNEIEAINKRRLTNIGVFRIYIENYIKSRDIVNENMTFIVRQLQSNELGLPLEIYIFSKEKEWAEYEKIQSDIFDHILAILQEFGLRIFQNPTGNSFSLGLKNVANFNSK